MSKYTTEVRFICETAAEEKENKGYSDVKTILQTAAPKVFNFDFPIFDEKYRLPLEIKILRHYYTREISEETVGLWKLRLEDRMNVIMPYYNQLYKSELLEFNPLYDVDVSRDRKVENNGQTNGTSDRTTHNTNEITSNGTNNGEAHTQRDGSVNVTGNSSTTDKGTVNKNGTSWRLYSDTPQGGIEGIEPSEGAIGRMEFLTNATKDTTDEDTTSNASGTSESTSKQTDNTSEDVTTNNTSTNTSNENANGTENIVNENTVTNTEDYIEHVRGKQGTMSYSKMLNEFRETFLNIDKMLIEELSDLFFGLW